MTTLLQTPSNDPMQTPTDPTRRKPSKVWILFSPIYVPLLFVVGAMSIPWGYVQKQRQRRQERQFAMQMELSGRMMTWEAFESALESGLGTTIAESLSMKGPFRIWWTPEDIPVISPHNCNPQRYFAFPEPGFALFFDWCRARFTDPRSGQARLVLVPKEEKALKTKMASARFVSICSFSMNGKKRN